jgi:hypothetical protein
VAVPADAHPLYDRATLHRPITLKEQINNTTMKEQA